MLFFFLIHQTLCSLSVFLWTSTISEDMVEMIHDRNWMRVIVFVFSTFFFFSPSHLSSAEPLWTDPDSKSGMNVCKPLKRMSIGRE